MPVNAQIEAAVLAMEAEAWTSAIAALLSALPHVTDPAREVGVRLLLAQSLYETAQPAESRAQAERAHRQALDLGDRGLIWKSMALLESMRIIERDRL